MLPNLLQIVPLPQSLETVPEVTDARKDDLVGGCDVGGGADPGDFPPAFLDRVDEGADVAGDGGEEVDGGHDGVDG